MSPIWREKKPAVGSAQNFALGRYPGRNHRCKFGGRSVKPFFRGDGSNFRLFHRLSQSYTNGYMTYFKLRVDCNWSAALLQVVWRQYPVSISAYQSALIAALVWFTCTVLISGVSISSQRWTSAKYSMPCTQLPSSPSSASRCSQMYFAILTKVGILPHGKKFLSEP